MKKSILHTLLALAIAVGLYILVPGFFARTDVYLTDFLVPPGQQEITISVSVGSSAGYTRRVKNVSDDPRRLDLQFYSAYGGINGSLGERHRFVLPLPDACSEIRFARDHGFQTVLRKTSTGDWMLPSK